MTQQQDEPAPGLLRSLPSDLEDAQLVLDMSRGLAPLLRLSEGPIRKAMRETVWYTWEAKRLPRPLVLGKYPMASPWSPGARQIFADAAGRPGRSLGLVIEHVMPARAVGEWLLTNASTVNAEQVAAFLHRSCRHAVISRAEDRLLKQAVPDATDWWSRYRQAGLDPADFAPVV